MGARLVGGVLAGLPVAAVGIVSFLWNPFLEGRNIAALLLLGLGHLTVISASYAILTMLAGRLLRGSVWRPLVLVPLSWTAIEFLRCRAFILVPFCGPWYQLGYTQVGPGSPFHQIADLTGVYGISALVVLGNLLLYGLLRRRFSRLGLAVGGAVLLAAAGYGLVRPHMLETGEEYRVAVVHAAVPDRSFTYARYQPFLERFRDLTLRAAEEDADLVLWPEMAVPFPVRTFDSVKEWLSGIQRQTGVPLVAGGWNFEQNDDGSWTRFNAAFLFNEEGVPVGWKQKVILYPVGVEEPLSISGAVRDAAGWNPGTAGETSLFGIGGLRVGVPICFEGIFPEFVRHSVNEGAALLLQPANEASLAGGPGAGQSLRFSILRAVENRRWLCRSVNHGHSCFVSPRGDVLDAVPPAEPGYRVRTVTAAKGKTLYTRYGDLFAWLAVGVTLVLGLPARKTP
jgi:apolipoprotein N-acyltransferase